jgi:hypothetical protein
MVASFAQVLVLPGRGLVVLQAGYHGWMPSSPNPEHIDGAVDIKKVPDTFSS